MLMAVEILQSDWTAISLQQNKSGYRAGTRLLPFFAKVGLHPTSYGLSNEFMLAYELLEQETGFTFCTVE